MSESKITVELAVNTTTTNIPNYLIHKPFFITRDEAYYWTSEWQESIRRSHAELESGEYVDFDDPDDPDAVVRWLNS